LKIIAFITERKTAKVPGREIFNQIVACIEKNEAERILGWNPGRLAGNFVDGGRIIYPVDTGQLSRQNFPLFGLIPPCKENLCCPSLLGRQNIMWIIFRKR
jgi:hypothetical protein